MSMPRYQLKLIAFSSIIITSTMLTLSINQTQSLAETRESLFKTTAVSSPNKQVNKEETGGDPLSSVLPGGTRTGTDPLQMLQLQQIRQELGITAEQLAQIQKIETDFKAEVRSLVAGVDWQALDEQQREAKIKELMPKIRTSAEGVRTQISEVLDDAQEKRYKEILLQVYGWGVMSYELFGPDLGITAEQEAKLDSLSDEMVQTMQDNWEVPQGETAEQRRAVISANSQKMQQILQAYNQKALEVLTPEQQQKLETLKGAKFELNRESLPAEQ